MGTGGSVCRWKLFLSLRKVVKILAILFLIIILSSTVRNILLGKIMPPVWASHNSFVIIKMLLDNQHFPVDETMRDPSPVQLRVNFDDIKVKFTVQGSSFPDFDRYTAKLESVAKSDTAAKSELDVLLHFQPIMTENERAIAMFTLEVFMRACDAAGLVYFLINGSLLGSIRHHGMIPWDDDFDIAMDGSQWKLIRDVLGGVEGFDLYSPSDAQWKFYLSSLPQKNKPFKWPNVDIFFYSKNNDMLWSLTWGSKNTLFYRVSDVFPLAYRPFAPFHKVPVPRAYMEIAKAEFGALNEDCSTGYYIHKTNEESWSSPVTRCRHLQKIFPFVFRQTSSSSKKVIEFLKVGDKTIGNVSVLA